jgi:phosphate/sulfate permease
MRAQPQERQVGHGGEIFLAWVLTFPATVLVGGVLGYLFNI